MANSKNFHSFPSLASRIRMEDGKSEGPLIIAMKGHPGTGKSTLAQSIATSLKCPLIDKDDVRDSTYTLQLSVPPELLNDLSYDVVWRVACTQLHLGLNVVLDSPLSRRAHLDRLLQLAADAGARLLVVECAPKDKAEWRRRLEQRGAAEGASWHKPSTWRDLEALVEGYAGCSAYDVGDVPKLVLDTTAPVGVADLTKFDFLGDMLKGDTCSISLCRSWEGFEQLCSFKSFEKRFNWNRRSMLQSRS